MSEHTPGPWIYYDDPDAVFWGEIRSAAEGGNFALIAHQPDGDDREADFVLMAAAPDLLEALEAALPELEMAARFALAKVSVGEMVRAAIAKAKGEAS